MSEFNEVNIWLMGGLGNQLFQVKEGLSLIAKGYNVNFINNLVINESFLTKNVLKWKIHQYQLEELLMIESITLRQNFPVFIAKMPFFNNYSKFYSGNQSIIVPSRNNFGYFQNTQDIKLIKTIFKSKLIGSKSNEIILHLRLTDNLWIDEAITYYEKILSTHQGDLVILTDDINRAKSILSKYPNVSADIQRNDPVVDLLMMINCKKLYCSSSTFSWWGSQLRDNFEKVTFPKFYKKSNPNLFNNTKIFNFI